MAHICQKNDLCCLGDYKNLRAPFFFVDESGVIKSGRDPFFGIGAIKIYKPHHFYKEIRRIRDRHGLRDELKWNGVNDRKYRAIADIIDLFFNPKQQISFNCVILKKDELDLSAHFQNDFFKAYSSFLVVLLKGSTGASNEIATILADDYFSPDDVDMEGRVRSVLNDHHKRLAVGSCCQINSKSSDLIQVADLMLGMIMYDLKLLEGAIDLSLNAKTQILGYLHGKLGVHRSFFLDVKGARQRNFHTPKVRVMVFDPAKGREVVTNTLARERVN